MNEDASLSPSVPFGLRWDERHEKGVWRGLARTHLSGRQVALIVGFLGLGLDCILLAAIGSMTAALVAGGCALGAVAAGAYRPVVVRFELGASGFLVGKSAPISALAGIDRFDSMREQTPLGAERDALVVHLRSGEPRLVEIGSQDAASLRFFAARLNAALARCRDRYRD